jgi:hypothetical protein
MEEWAAHATLEQSEKGLMMGRKRPKRTKQHEVESRKPRGGAAGRGNLSWVAGAAIVVVALVGLNALQEEKGAVASPIDFIDVKEQTKEFIAYSDSIQLTPEQELVKQEALSRIPAPCCSDNSAYTCCCPCNMAKSWWGLSKHLIVYGGYGAEEVGAAVEEWIEFINPAGFSGNACYSGGCQRPFHRNGCGGMDEDQVVF